MRIQAISLKKSFNGRTLFSNFSFETGHNGIVSIEGRSGCGKTTLMKIIMKAEFPDEGEVRTDKETFTFSFCGQQASLLYSFSLEENIKKLNLDLDKDRYELLLEMFSFHMQDKKLVQLSGGERQKAELICCLSRNTDCYFLDEPFSSLDKESKKKLSLFLESFSKDHLIFLINHDTEIEIRKDVVVSIPATEEKETSASLPFEGKTEKRRNILAAVFHYFSTQKLYSFFKAFLFLASSVCFLLGVSYTNTKSDYENMQISLGADPFSAHSMIVNGNNLTVPESFFDSPDVIQSVPLTLVQRKVVDQAMTVEYKNIVIYALLPDTEDNLFIYDASFSTFFDDFTQIETGNILYNVEKITLESLEKYIPFKTMEFQSLLDGNSKGTYLFTSKLFLDSFLLNQGQGYRFNNIDATVDYFTHFSYSEDKKLNSTSSMTETEIFDSEKYELSVPGFDKGESFRYIGLNLTTTEDGSDCMKMSLPLYKYLLLYRDSNRNTAMTCHVNDSYILSLKNTDGIVLNNIISYNDRRGSDRIVYFTMSAVLLLSSSLYVLMSRKGKAFFMSSLRDVYTSQNLKGLKEGILISNTLELLPSLLLSVLFYFTLFIPLSNYNQMVDIYGRTRPEGFYYYSQQPLNNYFDNISSPVPFITVEAIFVLVFVLFALFVSLNSISLLTAKQKK